MVQGIGTDNGNLPSIVQNGIFGLSFKSCFGYNNSKSGAGNFANIIGVSTASFIPVSLSIDSCYDNSTMSYTPYVFNGTSGRITASLTNVTTDGQVAKTGDVFLTNHSQIGRVMLLTLTANQSIPNATMTPVAFDTVPHNTTQGMTNSSGSILIGSADGKNGGINRVKVAAGAVWDINAAGSRNILIAKNGAGLNGGGQSKAPALAAELMQLSCGSTVFDVVVGDTITLEGTQSSGGALNLNGSPYTFLSVEVMG